MTIDVDKVSRLSRLRIDADKKTMFEKQMNDEEWFAGVDKKCSANEINTYGFLTKRSPDNWEIKYKPQGTNKATKKAIRNIYDKYSELVDTIDEIYIKE